MTMKQESIEFVIMFQQEGIGQLTIMDYFTALVKRLYNSDFKQLSYTTRSGGSLKTKTVKYSNENVKKFINDLPYNINEGFELLSLLPDWKYKSRDINYSVLFNSKFNDKNQQLLVLTLNKEAYYRQYSNRRIVELYIEILNFLRENNAKLIYGFIFSMENEKLPSMYLAGIGSGHLSNKEEENLQIWAERNSDADCCIWNIFWGNLVTKEHLKSLATLEKVQAIIGKENFYLIDSSTYLFNLPEESLLFTAEYNGIKRKLRGLFNSLVRE